MAVESDEADSRGRAQYAIRDAPDENEARFTVEEAVEKAGFGRFQWRLSILTGMAWMADAMELMILSIIAPALRCEWKLDSWKEALVSTVVFVGMMCSSAFWGKICDRHGRRSGLILAVAFVSYVGVLSAFAPTYPWILILRGCVGFGVGGVPQSVTLYSEFLPKKARGRCIMMIEVFWAIGTCVEVVLAILIMPKYGWRALLGVSAVPLVLFTLSCRWLPESPRFHMMSGNPDKALLTLESVCKTNGKKLPKGRLLATGSVESRGSIGDLLGLQMRNTTLLLWLIWFACAFCYYGIVLMTTEILQELKEGTCDANDQCSFNCRDLDTDDYVQLLWTTLAEFPGLIVTLLILEYVGRKATLAVTIFGFALCTFIMPHATSEKATIFCLFAARAFISGSFQAAYVYTPEVYPTSMRAVGLGACSGFARVGALITPFIAQVLIRQSQVAAASTYGIVALLRLKIIYLKTIGGYKYKL
ncbi:unnamed protein product [Oikopleura dioica]|uniref:Major facilitator superfamily (MFS) profile domain-containing protein n=1 Tax=Oikopleura dioica TaxID=34765 RepID=E4XA74_OIKDI|nr:unnamed protein product [Oikopleura dioica]